MININFNYKGWQWTTLIFLAFIWGTSFILMKKGLQSYSYGQVAALRVFLSFLFLLPIAIKNLRKITRNNIKSLLIVGFLGTAIPAFLFTKAQTQINSSLAGMLNSLTPLFTFVIGLLFYRGKTTLRNILGIIMGLLGAVGLMLKDTHNIFEGINVFALFIVIATLCYGINVNEVKSRLNNLNGIEIVSLGFLFIGPIALVYLLFTDFSYAITTNHYIINFMYIAMLALFSSVLALAIFNNLIKYTTALSASSVTYIIPIFAILWGFFDEEKIALGQFVWIIITLTGVYLVNKKESPEIRYPKPKDRSELRGEAIKGIVGSSSISSKQQESSIMKHVLKETISKKAGANARSGK